MSIDAALEAEKDLTFSGEAIRPLSLSPSLSLLLSPPFSSVLIIAGEEGQDGADGDVMNPLALLKEGEGTTNSSPAKEDRWERLRPSVSFSLRSRAACVSVLLDLNRPKGTGSAYELVNPKDGLMCMEGWTLGAGEEGAEIALNDVLCDTLILRDLGEDP